MKRFIYLRWIYFTYHLFNWVLSFVFVCVIDTSDRLTNNCPRMFSKRLEVAILHKLPQMWCSDIHRIQNRQTRQNVCGQFLSFPLISPCLLSPIHQTSIQLFSRRQSRKTLEVTHWRMYDICVTLSPPAKMAEWPKQPKSFVLVGKSYNTYNRNYNWVRCVGSSLVL